VPKAKKGGYSQVKIKFGSKTGADADKEDNDNNSQAL